MFSTNTVPEANSAPFASKSLTGLPTDLADAEAQTGGIFEVSYLPTIDWDPAYLALIAADANGDIDPDAGQIANSSQKNCILYYNHLNSRRRSGDANRTSFMQTLDQLGYKGCYDVYDHMGLGNTNNHLGGRATVAQATGYALIIYDRGNAGISTNLPDGIDLDGAKIDQAGWFQGYLGQGTISEIGIASPMIATERMDRRNRMRTSTASPPPSHMLLRTSATASSM